MSQQVSLQVGPLVETARANRAFVRRLFQMEDPMDGQRPRLAETLAAIGAFERFLFRMNVSIQKEK